LELQTKYDDKVKYIIDAFDNNEKNFKSQLDDLQKRNDDLNSRVEQLTNQTQSQSENNVKLIAEIHDLKSKHKKEFDQLKKEYDQMVRYNRKELQQVIYPDLNDVDKNMKNLEKIHRAKSQEITSRFDKSSQPPIVKPVLLPHFKSDQSSSSIPTINLEEQKHDPHEQKPEPKITNPEPKKDTFFQKGLNLIGKFLSSDDRIKDNTKVSKIYEFLLNDEASFNKYPILRRALEHHSDGQTLTDLVDNRIDVFNNTKDPSKFDHMVRIEAKLRLQQLRDAIIQLLDLDYITKDYADYLLKNKILKVKGIDNPQTKKATTKKNKK